MTTHIITDTNKLFYSKLLNFPKNLIALYPEASETTGGVTTMQAGGFKLAENMEVEYVRSTFVFKGGTGIRIYNVKLQIKRESTTGVLVTSDTIQFSIPANQGDVMMRLNFPVNGFICETGVNYSVDAICDRATFYMVCNYPEVYRTMTGSIPRVNPKYEILGYKII